MLGLPEIKAIPETIKGPIKTEDFHEVIKAKNSAALSSGMRVLK